MGRLSWIVLIISFMFSACLPAEEERPTEDQWSQDLVKQALASRKARADTLPHLHLELREILPAAWGNFQTRELQSYGLYEQQTFWSEAHAVYFQADRSFVEIYLTDLAADSKAFLNIYAHYEEAINSSSNKEVWPENEAEVFAWEWIDKRSQLHYLEAGILNRYHLIIRTDLPESKKILESSWAKIAWKKLRKMADSKTKSS